MVLSCGPNNKLKSLWQVGLRWAVYKYFRLSTVTLRVEFMWNLQKNVPANPPVARARGDALLRTCGELLVIQAQQLLLTIYRQGLQLAVFFDFHSLLTILDNPGGGMRGILQSCYQICKHVCEYKCIFLQDLPQIYVQLLILWLKPTCWGQTFLKIWHWTRHRH